MNLLEKNSNGSSMNKKELEILANKHNVTLEDVSKHNSNTNDMTTLTDSDTHIWSGVVLNSDMVQKTMAGGRVFSYRALVMIGNLKGTGGFGVGG